MFSKSTTRIIWLASWVVIFLLFLLLVGVPWPFQNVALNLLADVVVFLGLGGLAYVLAYLLRNMRFHAVSAIALRDFQRFFFNPTGYLFIALFVAASSLIALCLEVFFTHNLANLDTLSERMPLLLLFFIPAVTMNIWADERRQGTEEVLLTLPANDMDIVLGKFLAAVGIYTVALVFTAPLMLILMVLGEPDLGVLVSTYVGYWLMGVLMISIGMFASQFTSNVTVAFILGAIGCALPVFLNIVAAPLDAAMRRALTELSITSQFADYGIGVVTFSGLIYFFSLTSAMIYANVALLGRRHWHADQRFFGTWPAWVAFAAAFGTFVALLAFLFGRLLGFNAESGLLSELISVALLGLFGGVLALMFVLLVKEGGTHPAVRILAMSVAVLALIGLAGHTSARCDLSEGGTHTLSRESVALIRQIPLERPVYIQAYYSPEVPTEFIQVKSELISLLKEYARAGGNRIRLNLVPCELYSKEAREAEKRFGIEPKRVSTSDQVAQKQSLQEMILGVAFSSGLEEVVIPFFDRGLPVEYELTRSVKVVSRSSRKKVGILSTDAKLMGGFDMRSMGQNPEWSIVTELKKQYDVTSVAADNEIPDDLDVLLVAQPSSLSEPQIRNLMAFVKRGGPTLLFLDPLPVENPQISPEVPKQPPGGPFGGGQPPEPKGDLKPLLEMLGIDWPTTEIVFNPYNPLQQRPDLPPEVVFIGTGSGAADAFNKASIVTSGLQQVVSIFPGRLKPKGSKTEYTPLLRTNASGGTLLWNDAVRQSFMGPGGLNPNRPHFPRKFELRLLRTAADERDIPAEGENLVVVALVDRVLNFRVFDSDGKRVIDTTENRLRGQTREIDALRKSLAPLWSQPDLPDTLRENVVDQIFDIVDYTPTGYTLAAEIKGDLPPDAEPAKAAAKSGEAKKDRPKRSQLHAIAIADLDLISEEFFEMRRQKVENLDLDNVTFVLNCVDVLAGDDAFVALRKRRIRHRTLVTLERQSKQFIDQYQSETKAAEDAAKTKLDEAQKQLNAEVKKVEARTDLDERTKEIQLLNLQEIANRRLEVQKANIDDEKRKKVLESKAESEQNIRTIQNRVRLSALVIPPLPPLLLGLVVFGLRRSRENLGANPNRLA